MKPIRIISIACLAIASLCSVASAGEKLREVTIDGGEVELPAGETLSLEFHVEKSFGSDESVVIFEAWIKAKEAAGFAGAIRVFLDDVELIHAHDRPAKVTTGAGTEFSTFTEHGGWLLAYGKDPEDLKELPEDSVYRIISEPIEITRFAIYLPDLSKGKHTLKVKSLTAETGYPVLLRNIVWKEIE